MNHLNKSSPRCWRYYWSIKSSGHVSWLLCILFIGHLPLFSALNEQLLLIFIHQRSPVNNLWLYHPSDRWLITRWHKCKVITVRGRIVPWMDLDFYQTALAEISLYTRWGGGRAEIPAPLSKGGFSKGDNDVRPDKPCCNWVLMKVAWRGRPDVWSVSRGKAAVAQAASVASVLEDFVIYYVWRIRLLMLPFHQRDIGCSIALTVRFHTCLHI